MLQGKRHQFPQGACLANFAQTENHLESDLSDKIKIPLFRATTETVLLYGSTTWSTTKAEEKSLEGTYTRMLRVVKNVSWNDMITNRELYGKLEKVTTTINK